LSKPDILYQDFIITGNNTVIKKHINRGKNNMDSIKILDTNQILIKLNRSQS